MKITVLNPQHFVLRGDGPELEALAALMDVAIEFYAETGDDLSDTEERVVKMIKMADAHVASSTEPLVVEET